MSCTARSDPFLGQTKIPRHSPRGQGVGVDQVNVRVAVAVHVCPEAFVPCAIDVLWLSRTGFTVLPLVTVAVPMSMPNSCHWKLPSALPNVATNCSVTFDGWVTVHV